MVKPMDRPPFRFAVQATNAAGGREWRETVRKVEDLGYSTLFLADHYLGPGPAQKAARTPRQDLAPIAAMAAAAAFSQTLRIGCRVFCIDYHVPAVLAKEAATLDLLSDGRLRRPPVNAKIPNPLQGGRGFLLGALGIGGALVVGWGLLPPRSRVGDP